MKRFNTDNLNPISVYYRIEQGSPADEAFCKFIDSRTSIMAEMNAIVESLCPGATTTVRGENFLAVSIENPDLKPEGFRLAGKKEISSHDGKVLIYPDKKTAKGKEIISIIKKMPSLPHSSKLVAALGFGYEGWLIIGMRMFRDIGYWRRAGSEAHVSPTVFLDESGKYYHGTTGQLVDQLPLLPGLVEITASEYHKQ